MSKILVEAKHAFGTDFAHSYLVFVDDDGKRFVTSLVGQQPSGGVFPNWKINQINTPWIQNLPNTTTKFGRIFRDVRVQAVGLRRSQP